MRGSISITMSPQYTYTTTPTATKHDIVIMTIPHVGTQHGGKQHVGMQHILYGCMYVIGISYTYRIPLMAT